MSNLNDSNKRQRANQGAADLKFSEFQPPFLHHPPTPPETHPQLGRQPALTVLENLKSLE